MAAWRAGAAILHVHACKPDGANTMDQAIYSELHERLCAETDAVIQLTTGGSPMLSVEERLNTVLLAPEMCSLNMGLLNFFIRGEQVFFANHRSDIEHFAREIRARDVKPELEVYNSAMLEEVDHFLSLGILEPPYTINFVLHTPTQGGQRGTPQNLLDMVDRLRDLPVPQEDLRVNVTNVMYRRGEPLENNAQLVERVVRIACELDREPATPDQARVALGLRGREPGQLPAGAERATVSQSEEV